MYKPSTLLLATIVFIFSCKKNNAGPPSDNTIPPATFSFQINGKLYQFDGDLSYTNPKGSKIEKVSIWSPTVGNVDVYYLTGSNGLPTTDPNYFTISIPITSNPVMQIGNYGGNVYQAFGVLGANHYANGDGFWGGDNYTFSFSFVSNTTNFGSGSFSATLSPIDTSLHISPLTILYGEFRNVKIIR